MLLFEVFLLLFSYSLSFLEASIKSAKFIKFIKCVNALVNLNEFFGLSFLIALITFSLV